MPRFGVLRSQYKLELHTCLPPGDYQRRLNPDNVSFDGCMWADEKLEGFVYFEYSPSTSLETVRGTNDTLEAFRVVGQVRENTWAYRAKEQGTWLSSECSGCSMHCL